MKNLNLAATLLDMIAARPRTRPIGTPAAAPEWRALQRRVVAARLGGDPRPPRSTRALFDDVQ
jgi:hypothetical protein